MNKAKFTKLLNIVTLGCWIGVFLSVIFNDLNANSLREIAIGSTFVVIIELVFEMLEVRDKRIRREANLKLIHEIEDEFKKALEEKQGEE